MTSAVTDAVSAAAASFTFEFRSTTLGIAVLLALLFLMFAREMVKVHRGRRTLERVHALDIAVWPLFIVFVFIIGVRLLELI
jgi:hypothetical protein